MDIMHDRPMFPETPDPVSMLESPSYLQWLDAGKDGRPFLQVILVRILATQLVSVQAAKSSQWPLLGCILPWITLPGRLAWVTMDSLYRTIQKYASTWKAQIKESTIFRGEEIKIPQHST